MRLFVMAALYLGLCAPGAWLADLCLRKWARTAAGAGRHRMAWLVPYGLLSLLPLTGALLPGGPVKFALQAAGNVWLGFYLYFGALLMLLLALGRALRAVSGGRLAQRWHGGVLCLSLIAALALLGYGLVHAQRPKVVAYDLSLDKPAGADMRVALIADLHLSVNSNHQYIEKVVAMVNAEDPDLVLVAGDVFTSSYAGLSRPERYAEALKGIRASYGVYAVYGNHDVEEDLLGGFPVSPVSEAFRSAEMEAFFEACGFVTLTDEVVTLPNGVQLAGRLDLDKSGDGTSDHASPEALLSAADPARPILVLEHEPREYAALGAAGADVVLSGHTHAGQLFPGNLIVPLFNENALGYARISGVDTFVTAGIGTYGPPMRVGTDSDITVINMSFNGSEHGA